MEDVFYNILWIDDEHETLTGTKGRAKRNGINLIPYKSLEGGISELERNYPFYDGVLLDAKFFESEEDEAGSEDTFASFRAKDRILQLPKKFVIFVLTGQAEAYDDRTFNKAFTNVYEKGKDEDVNRLFNDIKETAKGQIDYQVRNDHQEVFSIFSAGILSMDVELQVLELIKAELPSNRVEIKSMLSNIRSIHESCLLELESIGVIHDSTVNFNTILRHLSGNKTAASNWQPTSMEYQNDAIENLNKWLYFTCGKYIHNLRDENYNGYMISKYAVESLRTGLLEYLLWFKKTYEENNQEL